MCNEALVRTSKQEDNARASSAVFNKLPDRRGTPNRFTAVDQWSVLRPNCDTRCLINHESNRLDCGALLSADLICVIPALPAT